jgi:hypothetical protein
MRSGSMWTQQGELVQGYEHFAKGVALSSDGSTALISGVSNGEGLEPKPVPAAWVFRSSGATWIEQRLPLEVPRGTCGFTRLTPFGDTGACGVALSGDGSTALFGMAVYVDRSSHK